ncbi:hypothetical protein [Marinobacter sp.]|uniref:hypothetical protein n=1 Tax=Marinobacter sp. TaxID=50741 RepID=UPI002614DB9F|nr:hypothetical protein [Marinobacter sp.]
MRLDINLEKLKKDQQLLALCGVVIGFAFLIFFLLQTREESRPTVQGEAQLRTEIRAAKNDIADMSQKSSLDSVEGYWIALFEAASLSGLELVNSRVPDDQRYRGPLQSRTGVIEGETAVVLSTLHYLSKRIPLFLYSIKIQGPVTEVTVSVVGV